MRIEEELLELERRGWEALATEGRGGPFYRDVLDVEPVMLLPGGMVLTDRDVMIEAMSGPPWTSFELEDPRVVVLGADAGIVAYGVVAQRGDTPSYSALVSSAYARRSGGWRLAFHQQTPR